jgi:hypothetical protein
VDKNILSFPNYLLSPWGERIEVRGVLKSVIETTSSLQNNLLTENSVIYSPSPGGRGLGGGG